jgi:putative SOS response-associated peptidase YedK
VASRSLPRLAVIEKIVTNKPLCVTIAESFRGLRKFSATEKTPHFIARHSRMLLAGIQTNSDWTPDKNIRG